jgi:hypothetical protein
MAILPSASLARPNLPATVVVDIGPLATGLYHRATCPWLSKGTPQSYTLAEAKQRYYQPHCLCLTGMDAVPAACAISLETPQQVFAEAPAGTPTTPTEFSPRGYFTLGSTKQGVQAVQGTPSSIIGNSWHYEYSSVSFSNNLVVGYSNVSNNLKVQVGEKTNAAGYISVGSTQAEVLAVQGTPSSIIGNSWHYEYSSVSFSNGVVAGYSNISNNLRVK